MKFFKSKKKKQINVGLSNYELYLLRELLPFFSSYGEIQFSKAIELFLEKNAGIKYLFEDKYKVSAEGNLICYLKDNGYVIFQDKYEDRIYLPRGEIKGFSQRMLVNRYILFTDKGRSLQEQVIYNKKISNKIFHIKIFFNKLLFINSFKSCRNYIYTNTKLLYNYIKSIL